MPRFYFDLYEDGVITPEEFSHELGDVREARDMAITLLSDIIGQVDADQEHQYIASIVRDASHQIVYGATMAFNGYWRLNDEPQGAKWAKTSHNPLLRSYNRYAGS